MLHTDTHDADEIIWGILSYVPMRYKEDFPKSKNLTEKPTHLRNSCKDGWVFQKIFLF